MTKTVFDSETLAEGQQKVVACAFIHHDFDGVEKVFLPKRADTKKFLPGVYELPGGHIDYGEEVVAGLIREVSEEFEKKIIVGDSFGAFTYDNPIKKCQTIEVVYFARFEDGLDDNMVLHPEDHSGYQWFAESELHNMLGGGKNEDDEEYAVMKKGFALLRGEAPKF